MPTFSSILIWNLPFYRLSFPVDILCLLLFVTTILLNSLDRREMMRPVKLLIKLHGLWGIIIPGGPYIDKLAKAGNPNAIEFPLALRKEHSFDFSFSGLKSAVINYIHAKEMKKGPVSYEDVAASFQKAVVNALLEKTMAALVKRT